MLSDVFEIQSTGNAWFFYFSANGATTTGMAVNLTNSMPNLPSFNRYCGIFSQYTVLDIQLSYTPNVFTSL